MRYTKHFRAQSKSLVLMLAERFIEDRLAAGENWGREEPFHHQSALMTRKSWVCRVYLEG